MKQISLIKKAHELRLCKIGKHPITGEKVISPVEHDCLDLTDEWEQLQAFANNRRNIKLKLSVNAPISKKENDKSEV